MFNQREVDYEKWQKGFLARFKRGFYDKAYGLIVTFGNDVQLADAALNAFLNKLNSQAVDVLEILGDGDLVHGLDCAFDADIISYLRFNSINSEAVEWFVLEALHSYRRSFNDLEVTNLIGFEPKSENLYVGMLALVNEFIEQLEKLDLKGKT